MTGDFLNKLFILVVVVIVLGLFIECSILKEQPLNETTVCATENLVVNCQNDEKIIIESYKAGAKKQSSCRGINPKFHRSCCTKNTITDCLNDINDIAAYRTCTGQSSCQIFQSQSSVTCENNAYPIDYKTLQYYCIEDYRIGQCISSVFKSCQRGQMLYLTSPGYPNNVTGSVNCTCSISSDCYDNIEIMEVDVQIPNNGKLNFDDTHYPPLEALKNNQYKISDKDTFTSFGNKIHLNASLDNGKFLIAIRTTPNCILTITCPTGASTRATNCDRPSSTISIQSSTISEQSSTISVQSSTISIPNSTISIPNSTISDQSSTISVQSSTISIPNSTISIPNSTISDQSSTISVQSSTISIPNSTISIPNSTISDQSSTISVQSSTISIPNSTISIPNSTNSVQSGTISIQSSTRDITTEGYLVVNGTSNYYEPSSKDTSNSSLYWGLGGTAIAVGFVIACIVVILVVYKVKGKKTGSIKPGQDPQNSTPQISENPREGEGHPMSQPSDKESDKDDQIGSTGITTSRSSQRASDMETGENDGQRRRSSQESGIRNDYQADEDTDVIRPGDSVQSSTNQQASRVETVEEGRPGNNQDHTELGVNDNRPADSHSNSTIDEARQESNQDQESGTHGRQDGPDIIPSTTQASEGATTNEEQPEQNNSDRENNNQPMEDTHRNRSSDHDINVSNSQASERIGDIVLHLEQNSLRLESGISNNQNEQNDRQSETNDRDTNTLISVATERLTGENVQIEQNVNARPSQSTQTERIIRKRKHGQHNSRRETGIDNNRIQQNASQNRLDDRGVDYSSSLASEQVRGDNSHRRRNKSRRESSGINNDLTEQNASQNRPNEPSTNISDPPTSERTGNFSNLPQQLRVQECQSTQTIRVKRKRKKRKNKIKKPKVLRQRDNNNTCEVKIIIRDNPRARFSNNRCVLQ